MACKFHAAMPKIESTPLLLSALAALSVFLSAAPAHGAPDQEAVATQIEANALQYNEKKRQSVFTGEVRLVRGDLTILSERLELQEFEDGRQEGIAIGKPATFERNRSQTDAGATNSLEKVRGRASRITYNSASETLLLEGNAVLQRWRDGKLSDETQGQRITYADGSGVFTVDGGPNQKKPTRVSATIGPKPNKSEP